MSSFLGHAVSFSLLPLHTDTDAISETLGVSADSGGGGHGDRCEGVGGEVDVVKGGYLGRFTTDKNGSAIPDICVMHPHLLSVVITACSISYSCSRVVSWDSAERH